MMIFRDYICQLIESMTAIDRSRPSEAPVAKNPSIRLATLDNKHQTESEESFCSLKPICQQSSSQGQQQNDDATRGSAAFIACNYRLFQLFLHHSDNNKFKEFYDLRIG